MSKKFLTLVLAMFCLLSLTACKEKEEKIQEIDVSNYIKIEVDGTNGAGRVKSQNIDADGVVDAYIKEKGLDVTIAEILNGDVSAKKSKDIQDVINLHSFVNSVQLAVAGTSDNLSNGDTLNYVMTVDDKVKEETKFDLLKKDYTYTVEGLKDIEEVDIMQYITITAIGKYPMVDVKVNTDKIPKDYDGLYEVDSEIKVKEGEHIKNGDKVFVKVINKGTGEKIVKEEEKEFTIELQDKGSYPVTLTQEQSDKIMEFTMKHVNEKEDNNEFPFFLNSGNAVQRDVLQIKPVKTVFAVNKQDPKDNMWGTIFEVHQEGTALEEIENDEVAGFFEEGDPITTTNYFFVTWENIALTENGDIDDSLMKMNFQQAEAGNNTQEGQEIIMLNKVSSGYDIQNILN